MTNHIAELLGELADAERADDVVAIDGLRDMIECNRAELRRPGSGAVTEAMGRYLKRDGQVPQEWTL